ncbi:hypothetical protein IQ06DRAFT_358251 [Phaeosphaeriaceae sp. SRC1lsM3a]|nr:hypothetical protein IQ06DRAFT_358251 [Stagonospora sp. SRC1lsM3a]
MASRSHQHRGQPKPRPEPQRRDSHNKALFAAGMLAGAVAVGASMSHKYISREEKGTDWYPRASKQVAWDHGYPRQQHQLYGKQKATDRRPTSRAHMEYKQDCAPPAYQEHEMKIAPTEPKTVVTQVVAGSKPESAAAYWIWSEEKQMYFHDSDDGQLRRFTDGSEETLKPPPRPAAPHLEWDASRNMRYWRNDVGQCWQYEKGSKIPFSKSPT